MQKILNFWVGQAKVKMNNVKEIERKEREERNE